MIYPPLLVVLHTDGTCRPGIKEVTAWLEARLIHCMNQAYSEENPNWKKDDEHIVKNISISVELEKFVMLKFNTLRAFPN